MNTEITLIAEELKNVYEGEPWFGRSFKAILNDVDERVIFEKPNSQHSIFELLWHMINWREFTISRLTRDKEKSMHYFEENDWRQLHHSDETLWQQGLQKFAKLHNDLIEIMMRQQDDILPQTVDDREYDFRTLLYGIIQHDIYHLGQIAYINKMLQK